MALTSCAMAARVGSAAGGAAVGGLVAGPGGAAAGAAVGLVSYEAIEGDALQGKVTEAALNGSAPQVNIWPDFSGYAPWILAALLFFTPSGQYLLRKARERISAKKD